MNETKRESCDVCGSSDALITHTNGSVWCYGMLNGAVCSSNQTRRKIDSSLTGTIINKSESNQLIPGEFSSIPARKLSRSTCEFFNYQVGVYNGQSVQIANYNGAQKIRTKEKDFYWTGDKANVTLFGKEKWNKGKTIIITEGEIDALSIAEAQACKWPVVSLPNGAQSAKKTLQSNLDWLLGFEFIILCFDNDEAGKNAVQSCVDLFPPGRLKICSLSEKDANECLIKGKYEELTTIVFNAQEYRPDGIIAGSEINIDELYKEEPKGLLTPYPVLNEIIRGLKESRIYMFYAGTGNGKSTVLKEIAYHIRCTSPFTKIGNIFLEESQKFTALSYLAMDSNVPTYKLLENINEIPKSKREESFEKILAPKSEDFMYFYRHFGSLDSKRLFSMLEYLVVGKGVKVIILDHISILVSGLESSGEGERRDIDILVTRLRSFAERTGAIILVATQLKRKQGSYSEGANITESDSRGSGAIEHLSDVIISLNRNKKSKNPNDLQINVLKNRLTGITGDADLTEYNQATGRLLPKKLSNLIPIQDNEDY